MVACDKYLLGIFRDIYHHCFLKIFVRSLCNFLSSHLSNKFNYKTRFWSNSNSWNLKIFLNNLYFNMTSCNFQSLKGVVLLFCCIVNYLLTVRHNIFIFHFLLILFLIFNISFNLNWVITNRINFLFLKYFMKNNK